MVIGSPIFLVGQVDFWHPRIQHQQTFGENPSKVKSSNHISWHEQIRETVTLRNLLAGACSELRQGN